jgi:hypothetical protein
LRAVAWACLAALALGVVACELAAVRGRVVDRDTGAPIAGAIVVELWREAGWMGEPARAERARFATSDAAGRFELAPEGGDLFGGDPPPVYVFAHRDYGLVHAGEVDPVDGAIELRGARGEVTPSQNLALLCESPPREDWERELALRLCPLR